MTLGRVTQLPALRGQAGYRAQARLAFRRALANEAGMPLVRLGRAGGEFRLIAVRLRCHSRHGARDCGWAARRGISGTARVVRISSHISPCGMRAGPDLA